jgi:hypothetical protein
MSNRIITANENFPIQPRHIGVDRHLFNSFDHYETEISAKWLIRFAQDRDRGWEPFTYKEIDGFYARTIKDGFTFNRLVEAEMVPPSLVRAFAGYHDPKVPRGGGWIIKGDDDRYYFTVDFVARCFQSNPAAPELLPSPTEEAAQVGTEEVSSAQSQV